MENTRERRLKKIQPKRGFFTVMIIGTLVSGINPIVIIVSLIFGLWIERRNALKRKYITLIESQNILNLNEIAQASNKSYEQVSKDIEKMIEQGYFEGVYIDFSNGSVVATNRAVGIGKELDERMVICSSCGANTVVSSINNKCEYCGTVLE